MHVSRVRQGTVVGPHSQQILQQVPLKGQRRGNVRLHCLHIEVAGCEG